MFRPCEVITRLILLQHFEKIKKLENARNEISFLQIMFHISQAV